MTGALINALRVRSISSQGRLEGVSYVLTFEGLLLTLVHRCSPPPCPVGWLFDFGCNYLSLC